MESQFNAIHEGMSVEEVEDILGKPTSCDTEDVKEWGGRGGVILLSLSGGRVSQKGFVPIEQPFPWPNRR
jgi:hypothetical protein